MGELPEGLAYQVVFRPRQHSLSHPSAASRDYVPDPEPCSACDGRGYREGVAVTARGILNVVPCVTCKGFGITPASGFARPRCLRGHAWSVQAAQYKTVRRRYKAETGIVWSVPVKQRTRLVLCALCGVSGEVTQRVERGDIERAFHDLAGLSHSSRYQRHPLKRLNESGRRSA